MHVILLGKMCPMHDIVGGEERGESDGHSVVSGSLQSHGL